MIFVTLLRVTNIYTDYNKEQEEAYLQANLNHIHKIFKQIGYT
jgi:hypothetical protein